MAWNIVRIYAMARSKKGSVRLADLLAEADRAEPTRRQSVLEMRAALEVISGAIGVPIRKATVH